MDFLFTLFLFLFFVVFVPIETLKVFSLGGGHKFFFFGYKILCLFWILFALFAIMQIFIGILQMIFET